MTRRAALGPPQTSGGWRPGMVGVWTVRVRHVLWLLLLWMVCGLHLLYLFASYGAQTPQQPQEELQLPGGGGTGGVGGSSSLQLIRGQLGLNRGGEGGANTNRVMPPGGGGGGAARRQARHWGLVLEDKEEPLHLEGQQLRHLAHIESLVSRSLEKPYNSQNIPEIPPTTTTRSFTDKNHHPLSSPDGMPIVKGVRGTHIQHSIKLRSLLPNISDINNNSAPTGSADPMTSVKPDTWTACASLTAPEVHVRPEDEVGADLPTSNEGGGGRPNEAGWQVVRPGQSYAFSAYHDPRLLVLGGKARHGVIRVIGMTDTRVDGAPQFCQLWYAPPETHPPPPPPPPHRHPGGMEGGTTNPGGGRQQPPPPRRKRNRRGQYGRRSRRHQPGPGNETLLPRPGGGHPGGGHPGGGHPGGRHPGGAGATGGPQPWPVVVPAISDIVPETHGLRFAPFIYTCRLTSDVLPVAVSMTHNRCDTPLNYLKIKPASTLEEPSSSRSPHNYTVCVTPFNFNYNNVNQLVEKIEVDRVLGANRFIFYNHSSGPDLGRYLRSYVADGIVDVVQWRLPVHVDTWPPSAQEVDVHYFGQLAALNDCLYRSMFNSKMVVFTDMDEFIVPKRHKDWRDMVAFLHHKGQGSAATYVFQNAFFRTEWGDDESLSSSEQESISSLRIMSLSKTKRERYIYPWGMRSKFICDPLKVEIVGVHNIWRFVNDSFTELDVPADIGLLHHYRSWNKPQEENSVLDRSMHAYRDVTISRVRDRHEKVRELRSPLRRWRTGPAHR